MVLTFGSLFTDLLSSSVSEIKRAAVDLTNANARGRRVDKQTTLFVSFGQVILPPNFSPRKLFGTHVSDVSWNIDTGIPSDTSRTVECRSVTNNLKKSNYNFVKKKKKCAT